MVGDGERWNLKVSLLDGEVNLVGRESEGMSGGIGGVKWMRVCGLEKGYERGEDLCERIGGKEELVLKEE